MPEVKTNIHVHYTCLLLPYLLDILKLMYRFYSPSAISQFSDTVVAENLVQYHYTQKKETRALAWYNWFKRKFRVRESSTVQHATISALLQSRYQVIATLSFFLHCYKTVSQNLPTSCWIIRMIQAVGTTCNKPFDFKTFVASCQQARNKNCEYIVVEQH